MTDSSSAQAGALLAAAAFLPLVVVVLRRNRWILASARLALAFAVTLAIGAGAYVAGSLVANSPADRSVGYSVETSLGQLLIGAPLLLGVLLIPWRWLRAFLVLAGVALLSLLLYVTANQVTFEDTGYCVIEGVQYEDEFSGSGMGCDPPPG